MRQITFVTLVLLCGCAYSFNPSSVPRHLKTLEIPVVENRTLEADLAEQLTGTLIERFVEDNTLRVVQGDADAVLEGEITSYENRVFGFNAEERADEYVVILEVQMTLRDRVKSKELWHEDRMRGRASYFLEGTGDGVSNELEARALAMKQIVDAALAKTTEGW
jgi:hypothetical protein